MPQDQPPLQSAIALSTSATFTHRIAYHHLQILHALLQYPRVRWLLNGLDLLTCLLPLLNGLFIPSGEATTQTHLAAMTEAITFKVTALECMQLCAESVPIEELQHSNGQVKSQLSK